MCGVDQADQVSILSSTSVDTKHNKLSSDSIINLDHGDPTLFEEYWKEMGDKCSIVIDGSQSLSYFSDVRNFCWFLEPEFAQEIRRLHSLVGNAVTEDRYIVVGTGSTQLYQASLYALSNPDAPDPISVVSALPYYSAYPTLTDFLKSSLFEWAGDANTFDKKKPYIEVVTTPNNPDGFIREPVVNGSGGFVVHDLAYYWPQYTPITSPADHDIMLFTVSKSTGHAGTRVGWAVVKDIEVAKKISKFIELNTIGVSKDSQLRAAKILRTISESCQGQGSGKAENFFEYGERCMAERWKRLRSVIKDTNLFSLPNYPMEFCNFFGDYTETHPAFAWLKSEGEIKDCWSFLKNLKILARNGTNFGVDPKYVRVSMLDREESFNLFLERLSSIKKLGNGTV